ncbi:MAG: radical SAM protein [Candidatus Electrothrix sp. LOE1_4_5]|nr:radical SAM protein [Candidatus Electrothrix gigas]
MTIERVVLNFSSKCSLQCPYCFIPFDGSKVKYQDVFRIINRFAELNVKAITFGGGDPFSYDFIQKLISEARELGFVLHVDTNGIGLSEADYVLLEDCQVLVGLSLDSHIQGTHNISREDRISYEKVMNHLENLKRSSIRVKVNTIASKINASSLVNMAEILCVYNIDIWSLYQFMPILVPESVVETYQISESEFYDLVSNIHQLSLNYIFEPSTGSTRRNTYLFVSHDGKTYIHDPFSEFKYCVLGSIFDDSTIEKLFLIQSATIRENARYRYLKH